MDVALRLFISSPYRAFADLRRTLAEGLAAHGVRPWIAESTPDTKGGIDLAAFGADGMGISDACLEALAGSDGVICVLGDGLGSPVSQYDKYFRAKHFELELFSALAQKKPILVLELPEVALVPEGLEFVAAMAQANISWTRVSSASQALVSALEFAGILADRNSTTSALLSAKPALIRKLAGRRRSQEVRYGFPFWGADEDPVSGVNLARARELLTECQTLSSAHLQFGRLWMAMREVRGMPFEDACKPEARDVWDDLLETWWRVASFYGVHGHLYTGALAASSGLARLRAVTQQRPNPFNAQMSAKFSIIKEYAVVPRTIAFAQLYKHIRQHMSSTDDLADTHIILGSIQFRLLNIPGADHHFQKALDMREQSADSFDVAYAELHKAQSAALLPWSRQEARRLLEQAMIVLSQVGTNAQKKRHFIKAATVSTHLGQTDAARVYLAQADSLPGSETYLDQNSLAVRL